jgi:hypothetical protein
VSITVRPGAERGLSRLTWLDSRHSFSFGEYRDPAHMGFRALRVLNDDRVLGSGGFSQHPHRDMEILTWVVDGTLEHADSMGNGSMIQTGEAQLMTAGTGITHSEFNHSATEPVHFLQIWFLPDRLGLIPSYQQRSFADERTRNALRLVATPDGRDGSLVVHQDVRASIGRLDAGGSVAYELAPGRHAWLQVITGTITANGTPLVEGDGVAVSDEPRLTITSPTGGDALLCDLA